MFDVERENVMGFEMELGLRFGTWTIEPPTRTH